MKTNMKTPTAKVVSRHPDGVIPTIHGVSFPISIVQRTHGRMDDSVHDYNDFLIGLSFQLPADYYIEIHGTDNLLNAGYELPHVKILESCENLDVDNINERMVKLKKYTDGAMLPLPFYDGLRGVAKCKAKMLLHSQPGHPTTKDDNHSVTYTQQYQHSSQHSSQQKQTSSRSGSSFIIM